MGYREKKPASETPSHSGRPQSLRRRLLALLGVVLLVTLLIIGAGVSYFVFLTEQKAWQGRQGEAARNAVETVAAFIQHLEDSLTLVSLLDRDYLTAEPHVMRDLLQQNPALLEMVRLDAGGKVFASAYQDAPLLANLFTIPQSTWFRRATAGEFYLGNIQISPAGDPYLVIAVPAPDGGVVAARLRMNVLWDVVAAIRFGETGQAYVVNQGGRIVAHTKPEVVLAKTSLAGRLELVALSQSPGNKWNGAYVNFEGTSVVGTTAPVPGTGWAVVTELPQAEAFAVSRTAGLLLGGGMLLFGVLVIWVTIPLLGQQIFQPLERLRAGAERIGGGDLSHQIDIARQDEIGQVAKAFNEMVSRLREREDQLAARTAALADEVAERKRAEEALRKAHDELEIRVEERTAELAEANEALRAEIAERQRVEEALRERTEALERSNRELEQFAYIASHDLQEPLRMVTSYLQLLERRYKDSLDSDADEFIAYAVDGAARMQGLINDLLMYSRVGTRGKPLEPTDCSAVLKSVLANLQVAIEENGAVVTYDTLPTVMADETQLMRVFQNLISNAIKFRSDLPPEIHVEIERNDGEWLFSVRDNGIGIAPQYFERIFIIFQRLHNRSKYPGTGIGLAVCKKIVERHGGRICVASEPEKGSTFYFTIPDIGGNLS